MRATPIPIAPNSREGSWTQTPSQAVHSCCPCCAGPSPRSHLTRAALERSSSFKGSAALCYCVTAYIHLAHRGILIKQSKRQPEEDTLVLQAKKNGKTTGLKWPVPSLSPITPYMSVFLVFQRTFFPFRRSSAARENSTLTQNHRICLCLKIRWKRGKNFKS